ncbi:MAG TPA: hypothetical protein VHC86_05480 [Opitutaceae bacterium]|nr:hypothetical protein [Opitutaceae bacterium]
MDSPRVRKLPLLLAAIALFLLLVEAHFAFQRWLRIQQLKGGRAPQPPPAAAPAPRRGEAPSPAPGGTRSDDGPTRKRFRQGLADPAFLAPLRVLQRDMILSHYRVLLQDLGLSPEAREKFVQLLSRKQLEKTEAESAAFDRGLYGSGAVPLAITQAQQDVDQDIAGLLGPAGFDAYRHFETTDGLRSAIGRLQAKLEYTGEPLSDRAAEDLVRLLDAATPPQQRGGVTRFTGPSAEVAAGISPPLYGAILPENAGELLAPRLTPAQLRQWRDVVSAERDQLRLRALTFQSLRPPGATGEDGAEP